MSQNEFLGYRGTIEEAFSAAASEAIKSFKSRGPDDMARVELKAVRAVYGGIIGYGGQREALVNLDAMGDFTLPKTGLLDEASTPPQPRLALKLDVFPDSVYANLMPLVRKPQPHSIGIFLTVTNAGNADFNGSSPDAAIVRFSVLMGRTTIWQRPEEAAQRVTPITLRPADARVYSATWDMPDALELVHRDIHVVARFVPSGASAIHDIKIIPVY